MTDTELDDIRELAASGFTVSEPLTPESIAVQVRYVQAVHALLAEVDRLRTLEIDREWTHVDERVLEHLYAIIEDYRRVAQLVDEYTGLAGDLHSLEDLKQEAREALAKDTTQ